MIVPGLIALALVAAAPDCTRPDRDGKPYPICFDPGRGLEVGVGAAGRYADSPGAPGAGLALEVGAAILWRTERASRSRQDSLWMMEHRFLSARGQPTPALRELTVTAWEGTFRRHVREGFILVPTMPPRRLPFPFDVAIHARAGTWERRVYDGPGARIEIGSAALLLDPVRSNSGRFRFGIGPAMGYTLRTDGDHWAHELSPFTSALVDTSLETADGWWSFRLQAVAGWVTVPGQGTYFRARGDAWLERLVIALNDQPIWVRLSLRAAERDAGVYRATEVVGGLGLVMRALN